MSEVRWNEVSSRARRPEAQAPQLVVIDGDQSKDRSFAWPLFLVALVAGLLALTLPLVMNTHMAQRAYDIRTLKIERAELATVTADLEVQLMEASSPQALAAKAEEIGLVPAPALGVIVLETGTVEGGESAQ